MSTQPEARTRDRAATEARILDAARAVLAEDGFAGFGVNAVAARAGCDKKLITRYFGGLDGVLEALGGALGFWLGDMEPPPGTDDYAARMRHLLHAYLAALRGNALLQRILAWELAEGPEALRRLEAMRSRALARWFAQARGTTSPPPGVDAAAVNTVLLAALHYLVLRDRTLGGFANLDLTAPDGWPRIEAALDRLVGLAFAAPG